MRFKSIYFKVMGKMRVATFLPPDEVVFRPDVQLEFFCRWLPRPARTKPGCRSDSRKIISSRCRKAHGTPSALPDDAGVRCQALESGSEGGGADAGGPGHVSNEP